VDPLRRFTFEYIFDFMEIEGLALFFAVDGDGFHAFLWPGIEQVVAFVVLEFDGEVWLCAAVDCVAVVFGLVFQNGSDFLERKVDGEDVVAVVEYDGAAEWFAQGFVVLDTSYPWSPVPVLLNSSFI
jgi:hypothetical protein